MWSSGLRLHGIRFIESPGRRRLENSTMISVCLPPLLAKHGIDIVDAQALWLDPDVLEIRAKTADEARFLVVGLIQEKHWSAVVTYQNDKVRLISVRRSRNEEILLYES